MHTFSHKHTHEIYTNTLIHNFLSCICTDTFSNNCTQILCKDTCTILSCVCVQSCFHIFTQYTQTYIHMHHIHHLYACKSHVLICKLTHITHPHNYAHKHVHITKNKFKKQKYYKSNSFKINNF